MKTSQLFVELSNNPNLSFKDKKELVLKHRERCIKSLEKAVSYQRSAVAFSVALTSYVDPLQPSPELVELKRKLWEVKYNLNWLKQLSKHKAIRYALNYHWDFIR